MSVENFKNILSSTDWNDVLGKTITNESYDQFIKKFSLIYDACFPIKVIEIKTKNVLSPWITKGIKKSSKRKQKLYKKFLKKKSPKNEIECKDYKQLFEKIKKDSKKKYLQEKLNFYKNDIKNTWKTLKDVIGKTKINENRLPKKIALENKKITDQKTIAEKFNKFYINVGPNLTSKIPQNNNDYKSCLPDITTLFDKQDLTEQELKEAVDSLKPNKSPGCDGIHVNVIKVIYEELKRPLFYIFEQSLKSGIFPDKLKITKVFPIYKSGKKYVLSNYRQISVLPCFSKILERIMFIRLYNYLNENEILNDKQFGFRAGHSTEHAILELIDQVSNAFDNNNFVLGVFIDLSKAFDIVDHNILLEKLSMYRVKGNNLMWFHSYLFNRKQYIEFQNDDKKEKTKSLTIKCGVPQGSILGSLLFIVYVNDLYLASDISKPIMFADDTNLFCSGKHIKTLFQTANIELEKIAIWFQANKLFLNESKTKFTLFHKS